MTKIFKKDGLYCDFTGTVSHHCVCKGCRDTYDETGGQESWVTYAKTKLDPKKSKEGKLKLASSALHPEMITLLAQVAELSVEKGYEPLNWIKDESEVTVMYCLNASERHKQKAKLGIDINDEEKTLDGEPTKIQPLHLAQSAYNDLMAALLILHKSSADDRMFKDGKLK